MPPRGVTGASGCRSRMRRVDGAKKNNLTFDLSGVPKARPLEGRVRLHLAERSIAVNAL